MTAGHSGAARGRKALNPGRISAKAAFSAPEADKLACLQAD
jgi:hypothetical protein